jgi:hypothetical protein
MPLVRLVVVAVFLTLVCHVVVSEAAASQCGNLANRWDASRMANKAITDSKYLQTFGRRMPDVNYDFRIPEECAKVLRFLRWSHSQELRNLRLYNRMVVVCPGLKPSSVGMTPPRFVAHLQSEIARYSALCIVR